MNAVEIEEAISALAELPFDGGEFPFAFLQAFGNKDTTIKRLRTGSTNASDLPGGVLQRNDIHIAVAAPGSVTQTLAALRASPATVKAKARFILATDGDGFEVEELESGETVACAYADFPNHFGFFLHLVWIATVCGKLKTDYRYSNTLGWNTFPVPTLTEKNKADLTRCAEDILLAREAHFPATIADLYDPNDMPDDLREAHERNDEVLERIYIGRRFRNDTERLERLFELYTKMAASPATKPARKANA
ncbi:MAG: type IIL restriction-modification enzyme MmeI [Parvibaculaceae bacterium]